jgi:hypothetical protein
MEHDMEEPLTPWPPPGWPYPPGPGEPYYPPTPVYPQAQLCPVCGGSGRLPGPWLTDNKICHGCGGRGWVVVGHGTPSNITITYTVGRGTDECR